MALEAVRVWSHGSQLGGTPSGGSRGKYNVLPLTGNGTPLQYSCLENPMDGGAWKAAVHGIAKSRTRLSDFTLTFHFHALEKEMATHSRVLAWRIPGTGEPGGLPSMGSHRVGHDWSDLAVAAAAYSHQQCMTASEAEGIFKCFFFFNFVFIFCQFWWENTEVSV